MRRAMFPKAAILVSAICLMVAPWAAPPSSSLTNAQQPPSAPPSKSEAAPKPDTAPADDEQQQTVWMRKKLEYTQEILAGIATADHDKIARNASAMRALSRIEGFVRGRTPGYRTQLHIFENANDELLKHAEKENVDGAALAFTQLTISCVNCHKHLRETR